MEETFSAVVEADGITIVMERRYNGALSNCEPSMSIALPTEGAFGLTWLANAIEAKGFRVESAWAIKPTQNGLQMTAVVSEIA